MTMIPHNLQAVQARITQACVAARRGAQSVALLAVSKTQPPAAVREAVAAGQTAFGENYIQEAVDKISALADLRASDSTALQWHCIGPLQSNKTRLVAENFDWVHSVDRLKIAQRLSEQRPAELGDLQVCLQVNIDGGSTKAGVAPHEALALAQAVAALPRLQLRGLMTIPEPATYFEAQKQVHMRTKALFDAMKVTLKDQAPHFDTLSMGMSDDLEAAVHAGSTMVRVGTAIFGSRADKQPAQS
jgi:pyridoxal phosphate enzyme (YggS family)